MIAQIYEGKGEFDKALEYHKQYANKFPDDPKSFTAIGALYKTLGDIEQAKASYKKALLIEPENISVLLNLADIESSLGNFDQAFEQYLDALEVSKIPRQRMSVYYSLRYYYEMRGQFNRAIDCIQRARAESEKFQAPLQMLVTNMNTLETYVNAGKQDLAFEMLKEVEKKASPPFDKIIPLGYIMFYLATEDVDNAEKTIEGVETLIEALGIEFFRFFIFLTQGKINELRGEYDQAILNYKKMLELLPADISTNEHIGRCYRKLNDYEMAEKSLQDALKIEPFSPKVNYEIALVYWDWGKKEKALEHLNRAMYVWEDYHRSGHLFKMAIAWRS